MTHLFYSVCHFMSKYKILLLGHLTQRSAALVSLLSQI